MVEMRGIILVKGRVNFVGSGVTRPARLCLRLCGSSLQTCPRRRKARTAVWTSGPASAWEAGGRMRHGLEQVCAGMGAWGVG